jgi:transcriptional regulator with XRE-family HTH domain
MDYKQAATLRAKKIGVLLRDARLAAGKNKKETGQVIGVSGGTITSMELGRKAPSLPELELLSYYLEIPIEHFWSDEVKSDDPPPDEELNIESIMSLRQRVIAALVRQGRTGADFTLKDLGKQTGVTASQISKYENGEKPIPLPDLELIARALRKPMQEFWNRDEGPVSAWITDQRAVQEFLLLPDDLKEFVSMPVNRPYLELAQRMSEMSAEKLRDVAEGLLEISL